MMVRKTFWGRVRLGTMSGGGSERASQPTIVANSVLFEVEPLKHSLVYSQCEHMMHMSFQFSA